MKREDEEGGFEIGRDDIEFLHVSDLVALNWQGAFPDEGQAAPLTSRMGAAPPSTSRFQSLQEAKDRALVRWLHGHEVAPSPLVHLGSLDTHTTALLVAGHAAAQLWHVRVWHGARKYVCGPAGEWLNPALFAKNP